MSEPARQFGRGAVMRSEGFGRNPAALAEFRQMSHRPLALFVIEARARSSFNAASLPIRPADQAASDWTSESGWSSASASKASRWADR